MNTNDTQEVFVDSQLDTLPEEDIAEALTYAQDCMIAASKLSVANDEANDKYSLTAVHIAAENYALKFKMPTPALEEEVDTTKKPITEHQRSRIESVISYLYASAKRVFQYFFDWLRNQNHTARAFIKLSKELIGRIDSYEGSRISVKIAERGIVAGLHIDGIAPKRSSAVFEELVSKFKMINSASCLDELEDTLAAAKKKDDTAFIGASKQLHASLISGIKTFMNPVNDPKSHPAFRSAFEGRQCYATDVSFGQNYITAVIAKEISSDGHFTFKSGIARDAETPVRSTDVDALPADEIRQICRSALRLSEMIIEHARDEDMMQKLMREASYFVTKSGGSHAVPALQNFAAVANNHYFAYLRYSVRVMQLLMRWCRLSVQAYEKKEEE